ncbi:hypothetical protein [Micromonospora palythoicola]|uniref:hypothetical protein n=1 Tax=Micromonospora palythoicola TaxID=3120507 RepID=UPI002FCDF053
MSDARINRAVAIAEALEAERGEHVEAVRLAREAERIERSREPVASPDLSGGLDSLDIGNDGPSELAQWYRSISGAANRRAPNGIAYFPAADEIRR